MTRPTDSVPLDMNEAIKAAVDQFWRDDACSPDSYNKRERGRCLKACTMLWEYRRASMVPHFLFCIPLSLPYILDAVGPVPNIQYPREKLTEWTLLGRRERQQMMLSLAGAISALWWYSGWMPIDSREMTQHMAALYLYYPAMFQRLNAHASIQTLSDVPTETPNGAEPILTFAELRSLTEGLAQDGELWALCRRTFAGASSLAAIDGLAQLQFLPGKRLPELEAVADRYLGFKEYEIPNWVGAMAMNSGKIYEGLTRLAGQHVIQMDLKKADPIVELGMTPAPYLPVVYAQSADGVIAGTVVEIKTKWTAYTYDTLPDHYASQVIQAALCSNNNRVIFIAGQRRTDMHKNMESWEVEVDNTKMELTVEMLEFSDELLDRSRKLFVAFAAFMFQYAREHLLRALKATGGDAGYPDVDSRIKSAYLARQLLKQQIERDRIDVQGLIRGNGIKRTHYWTPQTNEETGNVDFVKVKCLQVPVLEFICQGDEELYRQWVETVNPSNLTSIAYERQLAYNAAKNFKDEDGTPAPKFVPIQRLPALKIVPSSTPAPAKSTRGMAGAAKKTAGAKRAGKAKATASSGVSRKRKAPEDDNAKVPTAKRRKAVVDQSTDF